MHKTGWLGESSRGHTYLTLESEETANSSRHCFSALPYHRSPSPFGSVPCTSKEHTLPPRARDSQGLDRSQLDPRGRVVYPRPPSRLHRRVDGHCTLNKAAGVNCTGFNERRSAHPSIRPLEWQPLAACL